MPNARLPQEIIDYIIDLLHNQSRTLSQCCLVSKSWVPRTRKHLFGTIRFRSSADLAAWEKTFPNPLNSPASYTRCLGVNCARIVAAVPEDCGWIQSFSAVVRLEIWSFFETLSPSQVQLRSR
ncbi:hypothetical protein BJ322DRAFT_530158 [Thelephora terrestris]|uniref:F-box domain-containing protein n=1 Tax=Thelephora terrestris TaxID=56493 RepID=A0A9P6L9X5_9AGAM|nr:hypothetical protein BJ322DRAFT_530158 [Thelephora terrestris]